jgi:dTDP-4-dehydrorhamnose reductase
MKILLFGKDGQVGWELQRSLASLGKLIAVDFDSTEICGNFTNLKGIAQTIQDVAPDVIVNAAAHTAVDKAEHEPDLARTINAFAPRVLAQEAKRINALLVHYSTDYVFDGSGDEPWVETDATAPLNVYGATKLEGELFIQESGCQHLIFRTSWVYGARGGNFAKTMLKLAQERDILKVINDQIGAPTGSDLLADITSHTILKVLQNREMTGLYHLVAAGETSWHGYARFVLDFAHLAGVSLKVPPEEIQAVATNTFSTLAKRPHNSRLNTEKLQNTFGLHLPTWQVGVARMLTEILDK